VRHVIDSDPAGSGEADVLTMVVPVSAPVRSTRQTTDGSKRAMGRSPRRLGRWALALGSVALLAIGIFWKLPSRQSRPVPSPAPRAAAPPAAPRSDEAIYSERPKAKIPVPKLPRSLVTRGPEDLARVCQQVEREVVSAGVSPAFASGVTTLYASAMGGRTDLEVYPVGLYYFIIREAGLGHDKATAARNLVGSHLDQSIRRFSALPARDRGP
jgi:hypothetical protein